MKFIYASLLLVACSTDTREVFDESGQVAGEYICSLSTTEGEGTVHIWIHDDAPGSVLVSTEDDALTLSQLRVGGKYQTTEVTVESCKSVVDVEFLPL